MLDLQVKMLNRLVKMQEKLTDERGDTNVISIIVILVVVLGLAILFRDKIMELANGIWNKIGEQSAGFTA